MAGNDDDISFKLDLDNTEFLQKILESKASVSEIGNAESFEALLGSLSSVGLALGAVGVAALAVKTAFDWTLEAEQIERINTQFNSLAKNAGIAPERLKAGLEDAAKGLVDTDDLLKIANEAIVKMGGSAENLPQIMEIARKSVAVFGGDAKTNFEAISNAIANGNTRMLKHYGITIDATKAVRDFAAANNISSETLSEEGRRHAILNAALEQGAKRYKDIQDNSQSATTILQSLKVTFKELGDTFILAFDRTIGPGIRSFLGLVQSASTSLKLHVQAALGDAETSAAAQEALHKKHMGEIFKTSKEVADKQVENSGRVAKAVDQDLLKQKVEYEKYRKELLTIDQAYYQQQVLNVNSLDKVEELIKKKQLLLLQQQQQEILQIEANTILTTEQKESLLASTRAKHAQQLIQEERQVDATRTQLLNNYTKNSNNAYQGIARSFQANTQKMKMQQADFGKRGDEMWNSLSSNATSAFTTMGQQMQQGANLGEATANALKGFFLGFLGDRAIAEGTVMLLSGIWPPNPVAIAGGGALIALGGALKAAAGSSGAPSSAVASPSVQATASGAAPPLVDTSQSSTTATTGGVAQNQIQTAQRTVQVNIAGNYFETQQTQRALMDLMRKETDATGFAYNQIGA